MKKNSKNRLNKLGKEKVTYWRRSSYSLTGDLAELLCMNKGSVQSYMERVTSKIEDEIIAFSLLNKKMAKEDYFQVLLRGGILLKKLNITFLTIFAFFLSNISIVHAKSGVSQSDLYQQLLDEKNDRIGLLQGNISSVLEFIGIIITILTILAAIAGFVINHNLKKTYSQIEKDKDEIKSLMDEAKTWKNRWMTANEITEKLNKDLVNRKSQLTEQANELHNLSSYNSMQDIFINGLINDIHSVINYYAMKSSLEEFEKKISENLADDYLSKLPVTQEDIDLLDYGTNGSEDKISLRDYLCDIYKYYKESIDEEENILLDGFNKEIDISEDIVKIIMHFDGDDEEFEFEGNVDNFIDWKGYYDDIEKLYEFIEKKTAKIN